MTNFLNKPVVGIDISADFSWIAILSPSGEAYRKAFKINHDLSGFNYLLEEIKKVEERYNMKTGIFMESTGVYHISLFYFLNTTFDNVFIINPLITNSNKNSDIRKVKNDKTDSLAIAKLGKYQNPKVSKALSLDILTLKSLEREYYKFKDDSSNLKKRLSSSLRIVFPGYSKVFSNPTGKTSLLLLSKYPTPRDVLNANKDTLLELISTSSRKGLSWSNKLYEKLMLCANEAVIIGLSLPHFSIKITGPINQIIGINLEIKALIETINTMILESPRFTKIINLLKSIPGVGAITAITLLAEIDAITKFKTPKQLVAFFGLDCSVNQSGKFNSTNNKISKRGTRIGRRALFAVALASIRKNRNGTYINKVLYNYYSETLKGKKPKVSLIAIMHKLLNYIFAVLRDEKPFESRDPDVHKRMFLENKSQNQNAA